MKVVAPNGEPAEIIATAICEIALGVEKLRKSKLNTRAIVLLLSEASGVNRRDVRSVLNSLDSLRRDWLK